MGIPTLEDLMKAEVSASGFEPLPVGWYNGVITGCEVKDGAKAAYLNIEVTVHDEDGEIEEGEYHKRKVWGMSSFSDKALTMPGGIANLMQVTDEFIDIPLGASLEELPALIAAEVKGSPVSFLVRNEQVKRQGVLQFLDPPENTLAEMRSKVNEYRLAESEFVDGVDRDAAGVDADLPF